MEELEQYKAMLSNCITKKKHEIMAQRGSANGSMVSSSVCSNKKLKTHGTKHIKKDQALRVLWSLLPFTLTI